MASYARQTQLFSATTCAGESGIIALQCHRHSGIMPGKAWVDVLQVDGVSLRATHGAHTVLQAVDGGLFDKNILYLFIDLRV